VNTDISTLNNRPGNLSPAGAVRSSPRETWSEWLDRHSGQIFIWPAVLVILIFAIFPTIASLIIAVSRVRLISGGFTFRFVDVQNFARQFVGNEQIHFLGRFNELSGLGWVIGLGISGWFGWWLLKYLMRGFTIVGFIGRMITALTVSALGWMFAGTVFSGNPWGTLGTTLFYVFIGCGVQFFIGLGLALLCAQQIKGRNFFRVVFFIPLMITPLGVGYAFRMIADTTKGPFAPVWQWVGLGDFAWATNPWTARLFIIIGDSWQWIPFIFIVMLAGLENVPKDHVEAAQVDGASSLQIFREITWPQIIPVAATVMLIRVIEAFKIVDLPNIMTSGGPGIATESMTLHSFFTWRANDFGSSAAVAYLLLFVTVVLCSSFFNFVVLKQLRKQ
jgi:multiple sugar transport system permease protein